jgi:hypothetical protein
MLTCRQCDFHLGLATAKMNVVEIARDRLIERRQFGIDEKVMMTGVWLGYAGRGDLHVLDPETDLDLGGDRRAVLEVDEEYPGIRSRGRLRRNGLLRAYFDTRIQNHCRENNQESTDKKSIHKMLPPNANMSLEREQVGAANQHRPAAFEPRCRGTRASMRMPRRTDYSRLARRRGALKSGLFSDMMAVLCL